MMICLCIFQKVGKTGQNKESSIIDTKSRSKKVAVERNCKEGRKMIDYKLIILEALLLYTPIIFMIMIIMIITIAFFVLSMRDSDDSDKQKKKEDIEGKFNENERTKR